MIFFAFKFQGFFPYVRQRNRRNQNQIKIRKIKRTYNAQLVGGGETRLLVPAVWGLHGVILLHVDPVVAVARGRFLVVLMLLLLEITLYHFIAGRGVIHLGRGDGVNVATTGVCGLARGNGVRVLSHCLMLNSIVL